MTPAVLVLALLLSAAGTPASAAGERNPSGLFNPGNSVDTDGVVHDRGGHPVGRIEADTGGGHVLRDNSGRPVGRVEQGPGGRELVIRDGDGRRQGTLERRP
ncbi:MAG TPA: hypothetical protein VD995_17750 [Azospirillum sp.]|nr:hypothetical protein [Azospirillum sp.]